MKYEKKSILYPRAKREYLRKDKFRRDSYLFGEAAQLIELERSSLSGQT